MGHQGIAYAFGGAIVPARRLMHGKTSQIEHKIDGLFKGVENPLKRDKIPLAGLPKTRFPRLLRGDRYINGR